jgi:hypothetical protein
MKVVYKYEEELKSGIRLTIPKNGKIIKVALQRGILRIWAEVNTKNNKQYRYIRILTTGESFPEDVYLDYIDTIFLENGLVFHIYEEI